MLNTTDIRRRFDRAAAAFDDHDFVHRHTADGLFERLQPLVVDAKLVVDLGCATGGAYAALRKRFRGATIVGVDASAKMLARYRGRGSMLSRARAVQADAAALPFADDSVDVVFANLLLPWSDEPAAICREVSRVLREDGIFAFSTLGPDSFAELAAAWASVGQDTAEGHVHPFMDMHDIGDALVRSGLRDPVLDVDRLEITYRTAADLFRDLTATGSRNCLEDRRRALLSRRRFDALRARLESSGDASGIRLGLELVYGHCWGGPAIQAGGAVRIDPDGIPIRRR